MTRPLLALLLLPVTAAAADSNDTYNFYFQKAPGPVTVNQGVAAKPAPAGAPSPAEVETVRTAAASVAVENEPSASDRHDLEIRLGYFDAVSEEDRADVFASQYNLGVQVNLSRVFGVGVDGFYLRKPKVTLPFAPGPSNSYYSGQGSYLDYAVSGVLTPFHFSLNAKVALAVSLLGGYGSSPTVSDEWISDSSGSTFVKIDHHGSAFAGARLGFDLSSRLRLEANYRKVFDLHHSLGGVTLACLL